MFSKVVVVSQNCLKLTSNSEEDNDDDDRLGNFLISLTPVLRRSVCSVDWSLRDTAIEFIHKAFLSGQCLLCQICLHL